MIRHFVIFGASGDLTARYLLPPLAQFHHAGKLPVEMTVLGAAPESWDTAHFQGHIRARLKQHAPDLMGASVDNLTAELQYRRADVTSRDEVKTALAPVIEAAAFYLALPPALFLITRFKSSGDIIKAKQPPRYGSTGVGSWDYVLWRFLEKTTGAKAENLLGHRGSSEIAWAWSAASAAKLV